MKIVIPELENPIIQKALQDFPHLEAIPASDLNLASEILKQGKADSMLSGLDYSSRDVLLAYKDHFPLQSAYFSSCFICQKDNQVFALADGGVNKLPSKEQLYVIVEDSATSFNIYTGQPPKIAMLSYSTHGSGGKNPDLEKIYYVIEKIRKNHPDWIIDGELQLDAAINPSIAIKKAPNSPLLGAANVLITPDLNSGNLLYKSLEQFSDFIIAGPIIQGFALPLADLSRGSTVEDVKLTLKVLIKLIERRTL